MTRKTPLWKFSGIYFFCLVDQNIQYHHNSSWNSTTLGLLNLKKIWMKLDSNLNAAHVWRPGYFFSFSCWYFCPVHRWCIRCSMFSFTQKCFISVICTMIYARHLLCSWFARCGGTAVIFSAVAVFLWKSRT